MKCPNNVSFSSSCFHVNDKYLKRNVTLNGNQSLWPVQKNKRQESCNRLFPFSKNKFTSVKILLLSGTVMSSPSSAHGYVTWLVAWEHMATYYRLTDEVAKLMTQVMAAASEWQNPIRIWLQRLLTSLNVYHLTKNEIHLPCYHKMTLQYIITLTRMKESMFPMIKKARTRLNLFLEVKARLADKGISEPGRRNSREGKN